MPSYRSCFAAGVISLLLGAPALAQVQNGSFEDPPVANGTFITPASIPGWTVTTPGGGYIEVQHNVAGTSYDGVQHIELDGGNRLTQNLPTVAGGVYDISFVYSPRPGRTALDCVVQAFWNDTLLGTFSADGTSLSNTVWQAATFRVTATGSSMALTFADGAATVNAPANDYGGYVDYVRQTTVSLPAVTAPEPGSLALLFVAGVPAVGLVRRRKKAPATA